MYKSTCIHMHTSFRHEHAKTLTDSPTGTRQTFIRSFLRLERTSAGADRVDKVGRKQTTDWHEKALPAHSHRTTASVLFQLIASLPLYVLVCVCMYLCVFVCSSSFYSALSKDET